jgi:hypothetical protein
VKVAQRITAAPSADYEARRAKAERMREVKALHGKGSKRTAAERDRLLDLLVDQMLGDRA